MFRRLHLWRCLWITCAHSFVLLHGSHRVATSTIHDAHDEGIFEENSYDRRDLFIGLLGTATSFSLLSQAMAESPPFRVSIQVQLDDTQTGEIVVEVLPEWAPLAAERFQQLIEAKFLDQARFFRVLPGYVAQFGIAGDPSLNKEWLLDKSKVLLDEPRLQANKKGTLSFASSGKNSRQTQIFINLNNNDGLPNFLDAQGFVPFARVIKGMDDVVSKLYSRYGMLESTSAGMAGSVNQGKAAYYGNEYLEAAFPKLSYIQSVKIME
jgi:peptidyl-prolyl cis-trans isomerase A (cyclophilin A)